MEKEREAFERHEGDVIGNKVIRDGSLYKCELMTHRWLGWQERSRTQPQAGEVVDALRKAREGLMFAGCMRSRHSIHDRPDAHEEMLFYANQVEETVGKYLPIVNATLAALTKPTQGEK